MKEKSIDKEGLVRKAIVAVAEGICLSLWNSKIGYTYYYFAFRM